MTITIMFYYIIRHQLIEIFIANRVTNHITNFTNLLQIDLTLPNLVKSIVIEIISFNKLIINLLCLNYYFKILGLC